MKIAFNPKFRITKGIKRDLVRIEKAKSTFQSHALKTTTNNNLLARYFSLLEDPSPNKRMLENYLAAHKLVRKWSEKKFALTESMIQRLHSEVYGITNEVLYLPPKARDVACLMKSFVTWINTHSKLAPPVLAALAHFGINSIHPYYDGNGRCARLLTAFILMQKGYDLQGHLCLEKAYAQDLEEYYNALALGPYHNYYDGPLTQDLSSWVAYFCKKMAISCDKALKRTKKLQNKAKI